MKSRPVITSRAAIIAWAIVGWSVIAVVACVIVKIVR